MLPHSSCQKSAFSAISFQIERLRIARLYILPSRWPIGQTIPKFLTEAPTACPDLSITVTRKPFIDNALAVAKPTIPAPITIADLFMDHYLVFISRGKDNAIQVQIIRGNQFWFDDIRRSEEHTSELQSLRHLVCR